MMKVVILLILSLVTYCSAQAYTMTQTDINNILNAHNQVRNAYNVPILTWSPTLAADSAAYAALCKINPLTHSTPPTSNPYGENLATYMASPKPAVFPYKSTDYHVTNANQWYGEEKNYNCPANTCDTTGGKMCGHLTQIVWRDTTTVGCGLAKCQMVSGSTTWYVQNCVCRYQPPGNMNGNSPLSTNQKTTTLCPAYPTVLQPISPTTPTAPATPITTPKAPTTPTTPTVPATPITTPKAPTTPTTPTAPATPITTPKAPTTPTTPTTPTFPTAPGAVGTWWAKCISNAWPNGVQKLQACAWEPWLSGGTTWCCPNPANEYDDSWPVYNLGKPECPDGMAVAGATAEENADMDGGLPMGAWIGIAIGIAVAIIIIIVIIIVVKKKKNDERV
jgi:hypothetical protein